MIKRSEGGGVSHAVRQRVAHSTAPGRRAGQSASSGCGQLSGDSGGCMRRDGTEERVACGPMLGSFNQNITRDADDSARDTRVGRRLLCRLPPGPPTIGGRVGRSATVSRDHTSFVRVVWMEAARRGAATKATTCVVLLSPRTLPSLFILGTKRKMDRRFQHSRRKEHKKGTGMRGPWRGSRSEWGK